MLPPYTVACKICGHDADFLDAADSSVNCDRIPLPETGQLIRYHLCTACGFIFTPAFDQWTAEDFQQRIYNADYVRVDPEFASVRPLRQADDLVRILAPLKGKVRILDYGGGTGVFAARMNAAGFETVSYDPVYQGGAPPLGQRFELIHCREVIEHAPDPRAFAADLVRYLAEDGAVYLSTAVQPDGMAEHLLQWWYMAPRNGHISLFSRRSLAMLWLDQGMQFHHFNLFVHLAWRGNPPCWPLLMQGGGN
ncbi:MAG TPA: class I SAM-dependent methyltransferase [Burkholderiales bacterium]|jgi:2-polyprenyl-6-hydroxyphenyl methylase/3-demethylubiquinone-9 3-methyltransferase|nr:class I SAM-dependent methyltransferase [Burkholderiales bacterium]